MNIRTCVACTEHIELPDTLCLFYQNGITPDIVMLERRQGRSEFKTF